MSGNLANTETIEDGRIFLPVNLLLTGSLSLQFSEMIRLLFLSCACILVLSPISAALKKVIILPMINIEKDANFAYLEATITDSLKERLREKFAFDELSEDKWAVVADQNFILRDDFHTRTAAMNLGILANQDIVISGGFRPVNKKLAGGKIKSSIHATAYLLDVKKKKTIATVEIDLPADGELFAAVGQVADRIETETRKVIPSKEDAARSGLKSDSEPYLADMSLGLRAGGGLYVSGYGKYFSAQLPALGAVVHARVPKLLQQLTAEMGVLFMNHKLKEGNDSALQSLGVSSTTANYMFSLSFGYLFNLKPWLYLEPQLGGGYVMQSTSVTGNGINSNLSNGFPMARAALVTGYRINALIDAALSAEFLAQIEQGSLTFAPLLLAGVHYKF